MVKQQIKLNLARERMVMALIRERQEIERKANEEFAGINAAINELSELFATDLHMPLESVIKGGPGALFLVYEGAEPEEEPEPEVEGPEEVHDDAD
jgi:hypothetical protein